MDVLHHLADYVTTKFFRRRLAHLAGPEEVGLEEAVPDYCGNQAVPYGLNFWEFWHLLKLLGRRIS
jgi:hypothetical protein